MLQALDLGCPRGLRGGPTTFSPGTLIVSIDFEGLHRILAAGNREIDTQMGVSILDPSQLRSHEAQSPSDPQQLIRTYHFASGSSAYVRQASEKFLFGETVRCSPCDFVASLSSLLPQETSFIMVAHSIHGERTVLRHLGYELDSDPRLSGIVDTYPMSGDVFNTQRGLGSLGRILEELGVEVNNGDLHCAGNDSHYTLQAALLLSERGYLQQCPDPQPEHAAILAAMRGLATAPVCRRDVPKLLKPDRLAEIEAREEVIRTKTYFRAELARHEAEVEEQELLGLEECWSC